MSLSDGGGAPVDDGLAPIVIELVGVRLRDLDLELVAEAVCVGVCVRDALGVGVAVELGDVVIETDEELLILGVFDALAPTDKVPEGVIDEEGGSENVDDGVSDGV